MGRRRELAGVTNSLAATFISRNNDLDGYWALGKLLLSMQDAGMDAVKIAVLDSPSNELAEIVDLQRSYQRWLEGALEARGIGTECVAMVDIHVRFGSENEIERDGYNLARMRNCICEVMIVDDHGKRYEARSSAWCAPHDPEVETRTGRQVT